MANTSAVDERRRCASRRKVSAHRAKPKVPELRTMTIIEAFLHIYSSLLIKCRLVNLFLKAKPCKNPGATASAPRCERQRDRALRGNRDTVPAALFIGAGLRALVSNLV